MAAKMSVKPKRLKFRVGKSTEVNISIKTKLVLPRALRPLCNKSALKKVLKTPENILFAFLNLIALGFEIEHAARRYPSLLITAGLEGVSRHEREREVYIQRRILMQLKRRRLVEARETGNRIVYAITAKGQIELMKQKLRQINKDLKSAKEKCIIIFDIPESERVTREVFRRFLKECGFRYLQDSVWCAHIDALRDLQDFIAKLSVKKWVRIILAKEII